MQNLNLKLQQQQLQTENTHALEHEDTAIQSKPAMNSLKIALDFFS